MRRIEQGPAPGCLAERRREQRRIVRESGRDAEPGDWNPGDCAQPARDALVRDQRGLCAYCMQRIEAKGHLDLPTPHGNGGMRIEHFVPRETAPDQMYEWENLLGVCGGLHLPIGGTKAEHCDRARGTKPLTLHPGRGAPHADEVFYYERLQDPENPTRRLPLIKSDDAGAATDIGVLNLNAAHLASARYVAQTDVARALARKRLTPAAERRFLQRRLATTTAAEGSLPPFAAVVAQYCRRKLRARGVEA